MNVLPFLGFLSLGLLGGILGGLFGIGGGIIIIPGLVLLAGLDQKLAQGTSLWMMIPPIGILAAWQYWKRGEANLVIAFWLCLGFMVGGYLGARWGLTLTSVTLRRTFGLMVIVMGLRMLFFK